MFDEAGRAADSPHPAIEIENKIRGRTLDPAPLQFAAFFSAYLTSNIFLLMILPPAVRR
jgi:hypothetical protein